MADAHGVGCVSYAHLRAAPPRVGAAQCSKAQIVLIYRSRRDFDRVSIQPPDPMASAPSGTRQSSGSVSQPSGRATRAGEPCRPRAPVAESGNGTVPSNRSSRQSSSSSVLTIANARRSAEPAGKPCRYQAMCLRISRMPLSSPKCAASKVP